MKKFNLYIADPRLHGEEKAKTELNYFPIKKEISCKEDLAEAVKYAHTPALFKPDESGLNKRRKENFVKSNVLIADIDNKKKKKNMKLIRTVREVFKDVEFLTVFSKSTDTSRGIYALHLYFPIGKDIEDVVEYEKYLRLLVKNYDFLDPAVKDAARLFFYTQEKYCDPEFIYYNKGNSIIEILDTIGEPIRDDYTIEDDGKKLVEGERNEGLFKLARRYYNIGHSKEEVYTLLKAVNEIKCEPPLPHKEVKTIAKSAEKYKSEYIYIKNYVKKGGVLKNFDFPEDFVKKFILVDYSPGNEEDASNYKVYRVIDNKYVRITNMDDLLAVSKRYDHIILDLKGDKKTLFRKFLEDVSEHSGHVYNRITLGEEFPKDDKTLYIIDKIVEAKKENVKYLYEFLSSITCYNEEARRNILLSMLMALSGRENDGRRIAFALIGERSAGKTILGETIGLITQGWRGKTIENAGNIENLDDYMGDPEQIRNRVIIFDNITVTDSRSFKRVSQKISTYITAHRVQFHEYYRFRARTCNIYTYFLTLNGEIPITADLAARTLTINMNSEYNKEKKERIINMLADIAKNKDGIRDKIYSGLKWIMLNPVEYDIDVKTPIDIKNMVLVKELSRSIERYYQVVKEMGYDVEHPGFDYDKTEKEEKPITDEAGLVLDALYSLREKIDETYGYNVNNVVNINNEKWYEFHVKVEEIYRALRNKGINIVKNNTMSFVRNNIKNESDVIRISNETKSVRRRDGIIHAYTISMKED